MGFLDRAKQAASMAKAVKEELEKAGVLGSSASSAQQAGHPDVDGRNELRSFLTGHGLADPGVLVTDDEWAALTGMVVESVAPDGPTTPRCIGCAKRQPTPSPRPMPRRLLPASGCRCHRICSPPTRWRRRAVPGGSSSRCTSATTATG